MLVRPLASVFRGSYWSSAKIKSRTLPWPPVILAIMSLPQRTKMVPAIRIRLRIVMIMLRMILRFLLVGFLGFFMVLPFWLITGVLGVLVVAIGDAAILSSPLCSSKSKAWTGFRKSSVLARGVGF